MLHGTVHEIHLNGFVLISSSQHKSASLLIQFSPSYSVIPLLHFRSTARKSVVFHGWASYSSFTFTTPAMASVIVS